MTNKMPVVGKRYVNKKTNKDYELFCIVIFTHKEAFYLKNTKDDLASVETLVEFWNRFEELPEDNLQEKKEISEVERALEELEQAMSKSLGKITCVNDVNKITFKLMDVRKAAQNLVNALEVEKNMSKPEPKIDMKEECVEPVSIKKETYRCAHDYVLKNQGYNSIDYLVRQYECSICGENKMTIQS